MGCKGACCAEGFRHQVGSNYETKIPGMETRQRLDKARPSDWRKNQDTIYASSHLVIYGCCRPYMDVWC